jgi:hypothetical protein
MVAGSHRCDKTGLIPRQTFRQLAIPGSNEPWTLSFASRPYDRFAFIEVRGLARERPAVNALAIPC